MPIDSLPSQFQLLFWGVLSFNAAVTGLAGWFMKRYIDRKDQRDDKIIDRLTEHDKRSMEHTIKIESFISQIKNVALDFKKDQLDHQRQVSIEFSSLHKEVSDLRMNIHEADSAAQAVNFKLTDAKKEMIVLYDAVQAHARQLGLGAQAIARHDSEIKTILKKIGPTATLVTQKKPSDKD